MRTFQVLLLIGTCCVLQPQSGVAQAVFQQPVDPNDFDTTIAPAVPEVSAAPALPNETSQSAVPDCVLATVNVGAKPPNWGDKWDWPGKAPDVDIREVTSGASNYCTNSYQCQVRILSPGPSLSFDIIDDDQMSNNDRIGSGQCALSSQCNLPPAAFITMTAC